MDDIRIYISKERRAGRDRWRVTVVERVNGQRVRAATTHGSEAEARAAKEAVLRRTRARRHLTVGDLLDLFVEDLERRAKETSVRHVRQLVGVLCDLDTVASRVTPDDAKAWYRDYQEGRAPATHRQALQLSKQVWRWALEEGLVKGTPWRRVHPEGVVSRQKPQLRVTEARRFVAHCQADPRPPATAALCALLLGMRPGEVQGLTARDIDDGGRLLWISDGKTANAARVLEIPELLRDRLLQLAAGKTSDEHLFPQGKEWLRYHLPRLCSAAGVPRIPPHGLRGTHASLATQAGATSQVVAKHLGHGSDVVTRAHYIDRSTAAQSEAERALEALLSPRVPRDNPETPTLN